MGCIVQVWGDGKCRGEHTFQEAEHFDRKQAIRQVEARASCAFCVRGCCRFGAECRRGMQADSDYGGSEDGQEEEPEAQVKVCEECGVEEVAGVLDKGQSQFRYAV